MKLLLAVSAFLLLSGCSNHDEQQSAEPDIFTVSKSLTGTIVISSEKLTDPWVILYMDSLLIIGNKKGNPLVELYKPSGELVKKVIEKGKDSLNIRLIGSLQANYVDSCIYVYDLFGKKTLKIAITKSNSTYEPSFFADFAKLPVSVKLYDKIYVNHGAFLAESRSPKGRLLIISTDGSRSRYMVDYPEKVDSTLTDQENAELYPTGIAVSPDRRNLAMGAYDAGLINLFSIKDDTLLTPTWSSLDFLPSGLIRVPSEDTNHIAFSNKSRCGYPDIAATNDYVYAIYSGQYFKSPHYTFSDVVRITSWDGKRRCKLNLDKKIDRLSVSSDNSILYGIALNKEGNPEIVSYNLKSVFK